THVRDVCTAPVVTITPDTSLREASARLMDLKVRRLPVCDGDDQLIGIVSETDIFMAVEERGWGPDVLGESKLRAIGTLARIRRMKVEEVMSKPVAMIAHDASVSDALARMAERGISSILVLPAAGTRVYGIVTMRDIVGKVVERNRKPDDLRVAEIMSTPLYTVAPHVTLPQCAARMVDLGVRRLTVTHDEKPVGIISDTDIFRAVEGRRVSPLDRVPTHTLAPIRHVTKSHVHTAADVMGREAVYIADEATVSEALALMESQDVLSLLVRLRDGELGIVTQRDIISKVVAQERDPDQLRVREITSSPIITVAPSTSIAECSRIMIERNIRRLPVEEGGEIIGVVRDTDIFQAVEERGWEAELALPPPREAE
ncbi:MAG: CBS domain-containing protein, partial [Chloroflexi bacterium]|nr:CBS domain-containing protein [Chloroflexota bacterium]